MEHGIGQRSSVNTTKKMTIEYGLKLLGYPTAFFILRKTNHYIFDHFNVFLKKRSKKNENNEKINGIYWNPS